MAVKLFFWRSKAGFGQFFMNQKKCFFGKIISGNIISVFFGEDNSLFIFMCDKMKENNYIKGL